MFLKHLLLLLLLAAAVQLPAQTCTALGQTPATAFPVCGTNTFSQTNVPICATQNILVPCTDGSSYQDKNPFWYRFTCFSAGVLLFQITPQNLGDDYDWQLFDITGQNPSSVFTNASLFVCCNWSAQTGTTGTNTTATNVTACAGNTPNFSKAPLLIVGHEYLLLVSHFTDSQSGYSLSFSGTTGLSGTGSITDTTPPRLQSAVPACDGSSITIKLTKKMKCSSLAANGSDFTFSPSVPFAVSSISGAGCSTGFDTDSIILALQTPLQAGSYQLIAQNGSDNNTLLDNCATPIPVGNQVPFTVAVGQPTPFDSLAPPGCAPQTLKVVFRKPVLCSSIAADGSDFMINGSPSVTATAAAGACNSSGLATSLTITLSHPLQVAAGYQLVLRNGTDGNTLIDECGQRTPAGGAISFSVKDTVSADFSYNLTLACKADTVTYFHDGRNGVTSWKWLFDGSRTSILQNPTIIYPVFGLKTAQLIVTNGSCTDTAQATFNLDNYLKANFNGPNVLCPKDSAHFADSSLGKIRRWQWTFGNGNTSLQQQPPVQIYPPVNVQTTYLVKLLVEDSIGCRDSLTKNLVIVNNCYIDVPTAFTPNGDGLNDYLYPLNAYKAENLQFRVYNRLGQLVWQTSDWTRKWDGRINGQLPATGAYVWYLTYTHTETKQKIQLQGTTVLIR